jgi:hypothetical protein
MAIHVLEGGTGVTNFPIEQSSVYQKAIDEYGDPALTISDDVLGNIWSSGMMCLHDAKRFQRGSHGLSDFWKIFRRLSKNIIQERRK